MRRVVVSVLLACLLFPALASAQGQDEPARAQKRIMGKMKIIGGSALVAIGLLKVANASTTGGIPDGTGQLREETFTSGLGVGLGSALPAPGGGLSGPA